jgi:hypothetical protein
MLYQANDFEWVMATAQQSSAGSVLLSLQNTTTITATESQKLHIEE